MENNLDFNEENSDLNSSKDSNLLKLLEDNLKISQEILELSRYIKRYVFWQKIFSWLKIFLIIIPLVLAIIYLPPFLGNISYLLQEVINLFNIIGDPSLIQGSLNP